MKCFKYYKLGKEIYTELNQMGYTIDDYWQFIAFIINYINEHGQVCLGSGIIKHIDKIKY